MALKQSGEAECLDKKKLGFQPTETTHRRNFLGRQRGLDCGVTVQINDFLNENEGITNPSLK